MILRMWSAFYIMAAFLLLSSLTPIASEELAPLSASAQEWLHIDDGVFWIYTSFWEHRIREGAEFGVEAMGPGPYVRVLMIGPFNEGFPNVLKQSTCEYYYEELHSETESGKVLGVYVPRNDDIYPENLSRPYIVYCEAPRDLKKVVPKALAFNLLDFKKQSWSHDMSGSFRKWLVPIKGDAHKSHADFTPEKRLMGCIKPIHGGPFTDVPMLVNFLVVHHNLGMQHFVIYDAGDGSPKLYYLLNLARQAGLSIEVRTWNLREHHGWMLTQTIHGEACMHDALLLGYENVLTIDLDEALVIHSDVDGVRAPTYGQLLDSLDRQHPNAAYYRFSNVFYVPNAAGDSQGLDEFLVALRMSKHLSPTPNGSRTKCIYKPHRMSQVYTHFGLPLNSSYVEVVIPPEQACVHHYRRHPPPGGFHKSDQSEDFTVRDRYSAVIKESRVYKAMEQAQRGHIPA